MAETAVRNHFGKLGGSPVTSRPFVPFAEVAPRGVGRRREVRGQLGEVSDVTLAVAQQRLKDGLLSMGARCERMLDTAARALVEVEPALAEQVFADERRSNQDELHLDELALEILAVHQPLGRDLRFTMMAVKVVADLERIADETVNLAERAQELAELPPMARQIGDLGDMASRARSMLHDALDSFVHEDASRARSIFARDDAVDALYGRVLRESRSCMRSDPQMVETGARVATCAKYVERIADEAGSIAEMVVFLVEGVDVRHGTGSASAE